MMKFIKQLFCNHDFKMTDTAKVIPSLELKNNESGIEIREHECTKYEKTTMLSSGMIT